MKIKMGKIVAIVIAVLVVWAGFNAWKHRSSSEGSIKIISLRVGDIQMSVSTPGTVLPKNRLEVKPPVNGRIEQVLVQEGQKVNAGETIVVMSSTERAALLDAARGQGDEKLKYWQEVYNPIPLIAPISGEVIVGTIQPGQTVTTTDPVVVLSDRLIVRAQVDETDIGKIKSGQKATVSLDAYPDTKIDAVVDHVYYESKTVNNVTVYEVDLTLEEIPAFFRSGMNANVDFVLDGRHGVLVLPLNAVQKERGETFVLVQNDKGKKPIRHPVTLGLADDKKVEIVSGLTKEDDVVIQMKKYKAPQSTGGTNPLMPQRRR